MIEENNLKKLILAAPLLFLALGGASECTGDNTSGSARETRQTLVAQEQAAVTIGMPAISEYSEKRMLKTIYELRDKPNLITYSYTTDLNGKLHKVCPSVSIGFGFPYAAQYTAPKAARMVTPQYYDGRLGVSQAQMMDQPEPNGLYMPGSADGTWVVCLHPDGKTLAPTYVEDRIRTYTFDAISNGL